MEVLKPLIEAAKDVSNPLTLAAYVIAAIAVVITAFVKKPTLLGWLLPLDKILPTHLFKLAQQSINRIFVLILIAALCLFGIAAYREYDKFHDVFIVLQPTEEDLIVKGQCTISVFRPGIGLDPTEGVDGKIPVTNFPKGIESLQVANLVCPNFFFDGPRPKEGHRSYKITDDDQVIIPIVYQYGKPPDPTTDEILSLIKSNNLTKEQILEKKFPTPTDKADFELWIENATGNRLDVWAYDCTYAYGNPYEGQPRISRPFWDCIRFESADRQSLRYEGFEQRPNTSGYFALFIAPRRGKPELQNLGIFNLYSKKKTEFRIEGNQGPYKFVPVN